MPTPSDIFIEHKLDKITNTEKFFVNASDPVVGGHVKFDSIKHLAAWIDRHDYRLVIGSHAHWRLP